jgi:hypothetical protein
MTASRATVIRFAIAFVAVAMVSAIVSSAVLMAVLPDAPSAPTRSRLVAVVSTLGPTAGSTATATVTSSALVVPGTVYPSPTPTPFVATFPPLNLLTSPSPPPSGTNMADWGWLDPGRPLPVQSQDWLNLKAAGRIALVDGQFTILPVGADPMVVPSTGLQVPAKKLLDVSWTRWVIEVPGSGTDEKGNHFANLSYWEFCGDGAMTVTLWYWQKLTGHPNVTGTAGYYVDPYAAEGVAWPTRGPTIPTSGGARLGTYWSGSDTVSGFTAHGRGFEFYLAMKAQPATWTSTGLSIFAKDGKAAYPTLGTPILNIQAGLNWEVSGRNAVSWPQAYYTSVIKADPTLARDLNAAVTLNVGRDGVPVIATVDTFELPNWQDGAATPHIGHAISIVGYDNTAKPPTYTYTETCGVACNRRGGNKNGDIHVIPQAQLVLAIQDKQGSGFTW